MTIKQLSLPILLLTAGCMHGSQKEVISYKKYTGYRYIFLSHALDKVDKDTEQKFASLNETERTALLQECLSENYSNTNSLCPLAVIVGLFENDIQLQNSFLFHLIETSEQSKKQLKQDKNEAEKSYIQAIQSMPEGANYLEKCYYRKYNFDSTTYDYEGLKPLGYPNETEYRDQCDYAKANFYRAKEQKKYRNHFDHVKKMQKRNELTGWKIDALDVAEESCQEQISENILKGMPPTCKLSETTKEVFNYLRERDERTDRPGCFSIYYDAREEIESLARKHDPNKSSFVYNEES